MGTRDAVIGTFRDFIDHRDFPCVAAKSALATETMRILVGGDLRDGLAGKPVLAALRALLGASAESPLLASTVVLYPLTPRLSEIAFEKHLWALLQSLYEADRRQFEWDPLVSSDPQSGKFAMSIGGTGYFVVGMHPGASRLARRAPMAAIVFNPHAQFRRLKQEGLYERLRTVVRERDIVLQGNANPMLADHGDVSEAAQYSGRKVLAGWKCPFHPHRGRPA